MPGKRQSEWTVLRRTIKIVALLMLRAATRDEIIDLIREEDESDTPYEALDRRFEEDRHRIRHILDCDLGYEGGRYFLRSAGIFEALRRIIRINRPLSNIEEARLKGYEIGLKAAEIDWENPYFLDDLLQLRMSDASFEKARQAFRAGYKDATGGELAIQQHTSQFCPGKRCASCRRLLPASAEFFYLHSSGTSYQSACKSCYDKQIGFISKEERAIWKSRQRYRENPVRSKKAVNAWQKKNPGAIRSEGRAAYKRRQRDVITLIGAALLSSIPVYLIERVIEKGEIEVFEEDGKRLLRRSDFLVWVETPHAKSLARAVSRIEKKDR